MYLVMLTLLVILIVSRAIYQNIWMIDKSAIDIKKDIFIVIINVLSFS